MLRKQIGDRGREKNNSRASIRIDDQFVLLADILPENRRPGHEIIFNTEQNHLLYLEARCSILLTFHRHHPGLIHRHAHLPVPPNVCPQLSPRRCNVRRFCFPSRRPTERGEKRTDLLSRDGHRTYGIVEIVQVSSIFTQPFVELLGIISGITFTIRGQTEQSQMFLDAGQPL